MTGGFEAMVISFGICYNHGDRPWLGEVFEPGQPKADSLVEYQKIAGGRADRLHQGRRLSSAASAGEEDWL